MYRKNPSSRASLQPWLGEMQQHAGYNHTYVSPLVCLPQRQYRNNGVRYLDRCQHIDGLRSQRVKELTRLRLGAAARMGQLDERDRNVGSSANVSSVARAV
jgi:hypothetical protein